MIVPSALWIEVAALVTLCSCLSGNLTAKCCQNLETGGLGMIYFFPHKACWGLGVFLSAPSLRVTGLNEYCSSFWKTSWTVFMESYSKGDQGYIVLALNQPSLAYKLTLDCIWMFVSFWTAVWISLWCKAASPCWTFSISQSSENIRWQSYNQHTPWCPWLVMSCNVMSHLRREETSLRVTVVGMLLP